MSPNIVSPSPSKLQDTGEASSKRSSSALYNRYKAPPALSTIRLVRLSHPLFHNQEKQPLLHCKHWLEVADPYHRYGTFLRPYYDEWRTRPCSTNVHFFTWLDAGQGRYLDLKATKATPTEAPSSSSPSLSSPSSPPCSTSTKDGKQNNIVSRNQLEKAIVKYCNKEERLWYMIKVNKNGDLFWANRPGEPLVHTSDDQRWIFVIDEQFNMFINSKKKSVFHHSSLVAGEPVRAAGRIEVSTGKIKNISQNSGHYLTTMPVLLCALFHVFGECCLPIASFRKYE